MLNATAYQTTDCILRRPPVRTLVEPRNWCVRCYEYAAEGMLCPVCMDNDRRLEASHG